MSIQQGISAWQRAANQLDQHVERHAHSPFFGDLLFNENEEEDDEENSENGDSSMSSQEEGEQEDEETEDSIENIHQISNSNDYSSLTKTIDGYMNEEDDDSVKLFDLHIGIAKKSR
jgi:cobalamin biosynthesis protein CobT